MSGRVYDPVRTVCQVYSQVGSVRRTAKELKVSEHAVCKCLITGGAWGNEISAAIAELQRKGLSKADILDELMITAKTYCRYTPYTRPPYISQIKTDNAIRIADCRARQLG